MKKEKEELKPIIVKSELGISKVYPRGKGVGNDYPFWILGKYLILLCIIILIINIVIVILRG